MVNDYFTTENIACMCTVAVHVHANRSHYVRKLQINALEFDANTEIVAMLSAEGETVPMVKKISPNAAGVS